MRFLPYSLLALPLVASAGCAETPQGGFADVAPIVEQHCTSCHQDGGGAPFALTRFEDIAARADLIATVTTARLMPPSTIDASGACRSFQGARWLSDEEIDVLARWAKDGAPKGAGPDRVAAPPVEKLSGADLLVDMPGPYLPKSTAEHPNDDYRCFKIPAVTAEDSYLQGFEITPGDAAMVHHMLLFAIPSESGEQEVDALDAADPELGFECFSTTFVDDVTSFLGGWAPGDSTVRYPEGTGLLVPGGRPLVMQIHYNLLTGARSDRTHVMLKTVPSVEAEAAIFPVADTDMVVPAGEANTTWSMSYPLVGIADDLLIHGVFPHMHTLGQTLKLEVSPLGSEDDRTCLADVWRWDFHWQQLWLYEQPVVVFASDVVHLECSYDTSTRDTPVAWGEGTQDEMCLAFVYVTRIHGGPLAGLIPED